MNSRKIKNTIIDQMLAETIEDAKNCTDNILLFTQSLGESLSIDDFSKNDLLTLEKAYRRMCKDRKFTTEFPQDYFEYLMTLYIGEWLIRNKKAKWFGYKGKYHTQSPILIQFENSKSVDIRAICMDLVDSKSIQGARDEKALLVFCERAEKIALL